MSEGIIKGTQIVNNGSESFVVGAKNLINEIICHFLTANLGFSCTNVSLNQAMETSAYDHSRRPKVILLDFETSGIYDRPTGEVQDFVRRLHDVPVILFNFNPQERIKKWVVAGVRGFLYNTDFCESMVKAIKAVIQGQIWIPRQAMSWGLKDLGEDTTPDRNQTGSLTKREREILAILAAGSTNTEVANQLYISPHTVKVHIQNIYKKIGVPNRVKATLWAHNHMDVSC